MRAILVAQLLGLCAAQSPLTTLFQPGSNQGNVGGAVYFDLTLQSTVTLQRIDVNVGLSTPVGRPGTFELWIGPSTWVGTAQDPSLWVQVAQANVTTNLNGTPTIGVLQPPVALAPGRHAIALRANGFNWGYSNVPPAAASYANAELSIGAGAAQNEWLSPSAPLFTPRMFDGAIHYALGGTPLQLASWEPFGSGCYARAESLHEVWANAQTFDLGASTLRWQLQGDHYEVAAAPTAWFVPTSPPIAELQGDDAVARRPLPFALPLPPGAMASGASAPVGTLLELSSNGCVSLPSGTASGNGADPTPTTAELLAGAPRWAVCWKNLDPGGNGAQGPGSVHFDVDPNGTACYATWLHVPDAFTAGGASTFQIAWFADGTVEYRYQSVSQLGGGGLPIVVGWSPGGYALDTGAVDLSSGPARTWAADQRPLAVLLAARPILGTTMDVLIGALPPNCVFGASVLSFTTYPQGVDLAPFGMAGCRQYSGLDAVRAFLPFGADAVAVPYAVPSIASFAGLVFTGQAVACVPGVNDLGLLWSNGILFTLGTP